MKISIQFVFKIALLYFLLSIKLYLPCRAATTDARANAISNSSQSNILKADTPKLDTTNSNISNLSPLAKEMAELAGITPILAQLTKEQKAIQTNELSLLALEQKQRIIYLRGKVNAFMLAISAQINSTHSRIESAMAQADELRAYISEKRNRITRRNSQINLVSGGLTKMSGYSIALGNITAIPTNVLEVFDGAVQSSLSALALREQRKEKKLEHGMPAILHSFLNDKKSSDQYAPGIWIYLNHVPPGSLTNKTRRETLIENWQKTNILPRPSDPSNQSKIKQPATEELLDQRLAMLSDLKSEVSEMNNGLMELSNAVALSYSSDPNI
jgi:hypothetical protein